LTAARAHAEQRINSEVACVAFLNGERDGATERQSHSEGTEDSERTGPEQAAEHMEIGVT
jgi:hypothetical protein